MNNKLNTPDEIYFGKKDYSWRMDWKVNGWMFVAMIMSGAIEEFFPDKIKTWFVAFRVIAAIAPFLAILLWVRDLKRWVHGMDELHRRITLSAIVFAMSAAFFVVTLWHTLAKTGIWPSFFLHFFDFNSVWAILALMTVFYFHGYSIFNRRYQ